MSGSKIDDDVLMAFSEIDIGLGKFSLKLCDWDMWDKLRCFLSDLPLQFGLNESCDSDNAGIGCKDGIFVEDEVGSEERDDDGLANAILSCDDLLEADALLKGWLDIIGLDAIFGLVSCDILSSDEKEIDSNILKLLKNLQKISTILFNFADFWIIEYSFLFFWVNLFIVFSS